MFRFFFSQIKWVFFSVSIIVWKIMQIILMADLILCIHCCPVYCVSLALYFRFDYNILNVNWSLLIQLYKNLIRVWFTIKMYKTWKSQMVEIWHHTSHRMKISNKKLFLENKFLKFCSNILKTCLKSKFYRKIDYYKLS